MKRSILAVAMLAISTPAFANPVDIFFSTTPGPSATGTVAPGNASATTTVGVPTTLYIWANFSNTNDVVSALGMDIKATGTAAITGNSATQDNPTFKAGKSNLVRWDSATTGPANAGGYLFSDFRPLAVSAAGLNGGDPDCDQGGLGYTSYVGSINFTATTAGTSNLFFDVSSFHINYTAASPDFNSHLVSFGINDNPVDGHADGTMSSVADAIITVNGVPEPASLTMLGLGMVALLARKRRRA